MLIVKEFEVARQLANSDGKLVLNLGTSEHVAIYDDKVVDDAAVHKFINNFDGDTFCDGDIVVLPSTVWRRLHDMIVDNYEVAERM